MHGRRSRPIARFRSHGAPNSALKLTVRRRFSRRPSRLPHLEFARRRATCTGIIGCAASGAPLDRRPPSGGPQFNVKTLARLLLTGRNNLQSRGVPAFSFHVTTQLTEFNLRLTVNLLASSGMSSLED